MQLAEQSHKDLAITDPEKYLNLYCIELSKLPGIEITKVNQMAKLELDGQVPAHNFTDLVDSKFKNQSQLEKGKLRHKGELTKEKKLSWLKKQPNWLVDKIYNEARRTIQPEVESDSYAKGNKNDSS